MAKKIAIIGCGTIGGAIIDAIVKGKVPGGEIKGIVDIDSNAINSLSSSVGSNITFRSFEDFFDSPIFNNVDIVVESASQKVVLEFGRRILESQKDLMVMSVGAFAQGSFFLELVDTARSHRSRLILPSGAITGIDAIRCARDIIKSVSITTTKNPISLAGAPFFKNSEIKVEGIKSRRTLYNGNARNVILEFPSNVNVAVSLALAGIGLDKTKVKVIADPQITVNQHKIIAKGDFGEIRVLVRNNPSTLNPKTSFLAVLSAIECLRNYCDDTVRLGS